MKVCYLLKRLPLTQIGISGLGKYLSYQGNQYHTLHATTENLSKLNKEQRERLLDELFDSLDWGNILPPEGDLMLSWEEIKGMSQDGISFGAHTFNHSALTLLPLRVAKGEIIHSKKQIEEKIGKETRTFSYPFGIFNTQIRELVKESGFKCAVTTIPRRINLKTNPSELGRFETAENFHKFKLVISGLYHDLKTFWGLRGVG